MPVEAAPVRPSSFATSGPSDGQLCCDGHCRLRLGEWTPPGGASPGGPVNNCPTRRASTRTVHPAATGSDPRSTSHARFHSRRHITHARTLTDRLTRAYAHARETRARGARERFARTGGHHVAEFLTGHRRHRTAAEAIMTFLALDVFVPHPRESSSRQIHPGGTSRIESDSSEGRLRADPP